MRRMPLSEEFKKELDKCFWWEFDNIPNLNQPVLVIFNYSPPNENLPISFAFNLRSEPKCWMSVSGDNIRQVEGKSPTYWPDYKDFSYGGRNFYAYSVKAFEDSVFKNISKFREVCERLYAHIDQE